MMYSLLEGVGGGVRVGYVGSHASLYLLLILGMGVYEGDRVNLGSYQPF